MQSDRKQIERLLALNDKQLETVVQKLVSEYGLDLAEFRVREGDMESLRRALRSVTDADVERLAAQLRSGRRST